ncbi:AMP-dependent synthetase/ligase [Sandaracinobacter sp. RS1-74]|uniref:AMP-dependent synthetase/ligase n=1 Tax=Sandaracinobacteroides sayramensis TaxID=2913411 RepID=UPI001EDBCD7C|nr:AMP-dependent synthetase/ligase [Sandaracinobacteroides sayramensis]MCG2839822.1 AMP-dependent synthetase/ligase [Sandaracinobacteroides sayramensis]
MFFAQAERRGSAPFLWRKQEGAWRSISWAEAAETVATIAAALQDQGMKPGSRVMLVSENRPEFCLWDLGIMAAGGITVPTYTTNTARDHLHILENSGAVAAIVSSAKLARPLLEAAYQSSHCRHIIGFEPLAVGQAATQVELLHAEALLAKYKGDVAKVRADAGMRRADLACLIYTSGTGGVPRGVMQHHGAILHNVAGCADIIFNDFPPETGQETFLSFLPPSHAYEHTAGQYLPIALGGQIYYAESLEKLAANIQEVSPTIMVVVPRLFEVLRTRMVKEIEKQGGLAPRLLNAAQRIGRKRYDNGGLSFFDKPVDFLVERTLRRKIRERMGGRLKAMVSGGAPLSPEVGFFFDAIGVTLLQGYGQTEAGPVISCNRPGARIKMHTVGPPLKDTEVRIAEDGEILVAGELVMHGYWENAEETARVLTPNGWLMTGDIGLLDEDGHIVITDRKKDIIVNDKGDNVAPQRVEGMLTLQDEIAQAMVYGDKRPYLVGVVVPDNEFMLEWAAKHGVEPSALRQNPEFQRAMQAAVDRVNAGISVIEKVRRVILADAPFTVENEQMTPSLKIRRHILKKAYGPRLDALYK